MTIIWKEASAAWWWGEYWPTDAEYIALRHAKQLWDARGADTIWCNCEAGCSHGDRSSAIAWVHGEPSSEGFQKIACVKAATNRYGYASGLYHVCDQVRQTKWLMRWDGVPLKTGEQDARHKIGVLHGTVVHHHFGAPEHRHHGRTAGGHVIAEPTASAIRNFRSTW